MAQKATIVGIDVSSEKVDACIRGLDDGRRTQANASNGPMELVVWLRERGVELAVMEASGGYERKWAQALRGAGIEVCIVDPKRVRHFAKAAGRYAKNDSIDAEMIAWYAEIFAAKASTQMHDPDRERLDQLMTARARLKKMETMIAQSGEHEQPRLITKGDEKIGKAIKAQIAALEREIEAQIEATERFAERNEILQSVPGVGPILAAGLIAWLPELGHISDKQIAALVGIAPFVQQSGKHVGESHIQGGRHEIRDLLYMANVGASTQHNPVLKPHYRQLLARGKKEKVALVACMRKLLVILNAMLKHGEKWQPPMTTAVAA